LKNKFKVWIVILSFVSLTILFANYIANLLFSGKNSYETYENLQLKKIKLEQSVNLIQQYNAKLQKDYFELKNLEPDQ
jgi:cell division protein FtsB